jgi:hypothetical protein
MDAVEKRKVSHSCQELNIGQPVDPKGLLGWCMMFRITWCMDFVYHLKF